MVAIRRSPATTPNQLLVETVARPRQTNSQWMKEHKASEGVIFLGGSSVSHFRLRVAQSHLRPDDLTPSIWSQVGILLDDDSFLSVPLSLPGEVSELTAVNGVQLCALGDYDDPERFPNLGVVRFPADKDALLKYAELVRQQRSIVDLLASSLPWLAYVLGVSQYTNPLLTGGGIPSAVFVEVAYGMAGVEVTPGLSSSTSCPEAIWQAAKWWRPFYEKEASERIPTGIAPPGEAPGVPTGVYVVRQPAAAAVGPRDEVVAGRIVVKGRGGSQHARTGGARSAAGKSSKRGGSKKSG